MGKVEFLRLTSRREMSSSFVLLWTRAAASMVGGLTGAEQSAIHFLLFEKYRVGYLCKWSKRKRRN